MTSPAGRGDLANWRQGSLAGDALRDALNQDNRSHVTDLDWSQVVVIIISQDCDICAVEAVEPYVDALPFVPLDPSRANQDGQCRGGRNPRRLVLDIPDRGPMAAEQWHRLRIPKGLVLAHHPQGQIAEDDATCLRRWLGRRYTRAAFPDAFNIRLNASRKIRDKLDNLWAGTDAKAISGIYIRFVAQDDRPAEREITSPDESYHIVVRVTYPIAIDATSQAFIVAQETKASAERVLETFDTLIDLVDGIEMDDGKALPETDFTLHDLRSYLRFDRDFRSFDTSAIVPIAADAP